MYPYRTSYVNEFFVNSASITSVLEMGDSQYIQAFSRAIAVQREQEIFFANEDNFKQFPIFSLSLPIEPFDENITVQKVHLSPAIQVNKIRLTAISTSSIVHIGNSNHVALESRIINIRQLEERKEQ